MPLSRTSRRRLDLRIALLKPNHGVVGGTERVIGRLSAELEARGNQVDRFTVEVGALSNELLGVEVPRDIYALGPEFFGYLRQLGAFKRIDVRGYDAVISSQPPSFAVDHPRQLSVFYHHHRVYYDLSDIYVSAGFVDPRLHAISERGIRRVDEKYLDRVSHFLVPSRTVEERLESFNGLGKRSSMFRVGPGVEMAKRDQEVGSDRADYVLCVSRQEFAKRTELFIHAMKFLPKLRGHAIGAGGRLPWVRSLDAKLSEPRVDLQTFGAGDLWLNTGELSRAITAAPGSNVTFMPHVDDGELSRQYASALCVVAPALLEDYGLTVIEAMQHGKPVIVCNDGGGLTEFLEDGVQGLVVEPTGQAIAEAVQLLSDNPEQAASMGRAGRERAQEFTWDRAVDQLLDGLARVMG